MRNRFVPFGGACREVSMSLPERLKLVRDSLRLTQKEISNRVSVSVQMWRAYESGSSVPGGNVLEALARLGINVNWLLTGEGEMRWAVRLTESEAHQALKKRLVGLVSATGMQAHLQNLGFHGISEDTYRAYVYSDYLPTKEELEGLCRAAGGWTFETGTMATRDEEASAEIEKRVQEAIALHKMNSRIDIELLKEATKEIEEALFSSAIKLDPARKAEMFALVYDYASESEVNRSGIKDHVKRLLRLISD